MHSHLVERLGWNVCQEENRVGSVHVAEMECVGGSQGWQCACGWNGVCVGGSQGWQCACGWNGVCVRGSQGWQYACGWNGVCVRGSHSWQCACGWNGVCVGGTQGWQCVCGWNGVCVGGSQGCQCACGWNGVCVGGSQCWQCACGWNGVCVGGSQGWQRAWGRNGVCVGGSQGQQRAWDWNGAWLLAGFPQLHTLSLEETGVTDQGLVQYFATKPCLKNLNLNRTSVTNDIFTHLQSESIYSKLVFCFVFFLSEKAAVMSRIFHWSSLNFFFFYPNTVIFCFVFLSEKAAVMSRIFHWSSLNFFFLSQYCHFLFCFSVREGSCYVQNFSLKQFKLLLFIPILSFFVLFFCQRRRLLCPEFFIEAV